MRHGRLADDRPKSQTDPLPGFDLEDYFRGEFHLGGRKSWPEQVRPIRFWDIERFQDVAWADGPRLFDNRQ